MATQHGETDGFGVAEHLEALERHTGSGLIQAVVANSNIAPELPEAWHSAAVRVSQEMLRSYPGVRLMEADVVAEENRYRHDPYKLAATIMRLYDARDTTSYETRRPAPEEPAMLVTR